MRSYCAPLRAALTSLALLGLAAANTPSARADFLINPTGGTSLPATSFASGGTADPDDGSVLRSLGGTFSLYGTNVTSLFVQADGFLSSIDGFGFLADRSVAALAGVVTGPVISPYYDDLSFRSTTSTIVENVVPNSYYAITFALNGFGDTTAAATAKFQSVLFTGNTTVNGVSFLAGDIVFSYGASTNTVTGSNFSVGVAQNTTNATNAFGVTGGQFATNASFLTNFNNATQGLRFRPTTTGGVTTYTQTLVPLFVVVTAPEPGSIALVVVAGLPFTGLVLRRHALAKRRKVS